MIELLYDKVYNLFIKVGKRVGVDDETAEFSATFFLNGNIIPILSNLHHNGKLSFETVILSAEILELEVEKWKQQQ